MCYHLQLIVAAPQSPVKVTVVNTLEIPATGELEILARIHTTSAGGTWLVEGESSPLYWYLERH